jgi:DNA gyrase/topoisomerase IV subunit B
VRVLRLVSIHTCEEGLILAKPIFDQNSRVLLNEGSVLTLGFIHRLKAKNIHYVYSDSELAETDTDGATIQRYKGLGEMNPEQLWETTMNPETRTLIQVSIEDAEAADEMISICMSEEVQPRKELIMEYALTADIDI